MAVDNQPQSWSNRLEALAEELDRVERQVTADEIQVSTYDDRTTVLLTYHEDSEDGGGSA